MWWKDGRWKQNFENFQNRRKMKIDVILQNRDHFKSFIKMEVPPSTFHKTVGVINTILDDVDELDECGYYCLAQSKLFQKCLPGMV